MPVAVLPIARAVNYRVRRFFQRDTRVRFGALRSSVDLSVALKAACLAAYNLEADGTDNSGHSKTLTVSGSPVFGAGKLSNAWTGDGSAKYGSTAAALVSSGSFWVSMWVKWTTTSFTAFAGQRDRVDAASGTFSIDNTFGDGTKLRFVVLNNAAGSNIAQWGSTSNDGSWHLLNCWYDSGGATVNISVDNGTTVSNAFSGTIRFDATVFRAAAAFLTDLPTYLNGSIDALHVFSIAPSAAQLTYMWNSGSGRQLY